MKFRQALKVYYTLKNELYFKLLYTFTSPRVAQASPVRCGGHGHLGRGLRVHRTLRRTAHAAAVPGGPRDKTKIQDGYSTVRRPNEFDQLVSIITLRNRRIFQLADYHDAQLDEISLLVQKEKKLSADFDDENKPTT